MSRNLARVTCCYCYTMVERTEEWRPPKHTELGDNYETYKQMSVARAVCSWCGASYLAWDRYPDIGRTAPGHEIVDLSFYSTFNDEPGPDDGPRQGVVTHVVVEQGSNHDRVRVWNRGGLAGILAVVAGDGEKVASRLAPWLFQDEERQHADT